MRCLASFGLPRDRHTRCRHRRLWWGGSGVGPDIDFPDEPQISELEIRPLDPERANTTVRYVARVTVVDFQDDVAGGTCEVGTSVGASTVQVEVTGRADFGDKAECRFSVFVSAPGEVTGELRVVDAKGHRSNSLAFVLRIG
jgi:hypothetical protein